MPSIVAIDIDLDAQASSSSDMTATLYPSIYTLPHVPLPSNGHPTPTLAEQADTERLISELLTLISPPDIPTPAKDAEGFALGPEPTVMRTNEHAKFLAGTFFKLPAGFVALDASRPWLMYWTVHSLGLLGVVLDQQTKDRAVSTLTHFISPLGGFGGGPGQLPHLLPTYASVCSLAIVGHAGEGGGWDKVAEGRQKTYDFFMRCKQADGSFVVCEGGEVDVRGTYCLLVVATLLDILTPELLHNVDKFISACQTYEGGFACSAFSFLPGSPTASSAPSSIASMAEAHGGYSSCSLNSHFLLSSIQPSPPTSALEPGFPAKIDVDAAVRWSVLMQCEAIEAGGFKGRSNKLVDGCYGWWVGGGFPVVEELLRRQSGRETPQLLNKVALQEYVLVAAQKEAGGSGGLRDKPGKRPDGYHTCNNLSGLSVAQHHIIHSPTVLDANRKKFDPAKGFPAVRPVTATGGWASEEERQGVRRQVWASALAWVEDESAELIVGGKPNRVNATAPVFNILLNRLKPFINYFYQQD